MVPCVRRRMLDTGDDSEELGGVVVAAVAALDTGLGRL